METNELLKSMEAVSNTAVKYGAAFEKVLDFSLESIKAVEEILEYYSTDLRTGTERPTEKQIESMALIWGAYIGEVIKREVGNDCEWCRENVFGDDEVIHLKRLQKEWRTFPIDKVHKRLINGAEDNVISFVDVAVNL